MMRSLYSGLSGLKSHQTRMDVVGNNIANVNTVGFKSSRTTFADMLSQNLKYPTSPQEDVGGTNPEQIGLGVKVASTDLIFNDGSLMATGKNTDLCLSGDGLFVVQRGDKTYYTRNGAFEFDAAGNYVLPGSGHFVQGWMATDGVIDTTAAVSNIQVAQSIAAEPTTEVNYYDNLSANVPMITGISGGVDIITKTIRTEDVSDENPLPVSFGGKNFRVSWLSDDMDMTQTWRVNNDIELGATTVEMINESGKTVTARISPEALFEVPKGSTLGTINVLTKTSVTEQYPLTVRIDGKQYTAIGMDKNLDLSTEWEVKNGAHAGDTTITITNGTDDVVLTIDSPLEENIGIKTITIETTHFEGTAASEENPVTLTLSDGSTVTMTDGAYKVGNMTITYGSADSEEQNVTVNFADVTQFAKTTTVSSTGDGNTSGTLEEVQIDSDGVITGTYTNGVSRPEAQVAVAHFNNAPGLLKTGTSLYQVSANSGDAVLNTSEYFGTTITPGYLEMSNVDIASEFTDMIVTQRGFQSNSKIITVGDEMLETAVNMKR